MTPRYHDTYDTVFYTYFIGNHPQNAFTAKDFCNFTSPNGEMDEQNPGFIYLVSIQIGIMAEIASTPTGSTLVSRMW
jgi:hypothetical protein